MDVPRPLQDPINLVAVNLVLDSCPDVDLTDVRNFLSMWNSLGIESGKRAARLLHCCADLLAIEDSEGTIHLSPPGKLPA